MRDSDSHRTVSTATLCAAWLLLSAAGAAAPPEEPDVVERREVYRYEAVPKDSGDLESRETVDVHIVTSADSVEYDARIAVQSAHEAVRVVTDRQGRFVYASKKSGSAYKDGMTRIWRDAEKVYVGGMGDSGGKAETVRAPEDLPLAVDASLLILLRSFPFDTGREWKVFMVDFSGVSTTVTVRQAGVEKVATPAGTFTCYRMEVVVGVPILRPKITYWLSRDAPHFLVLHEGKRGPFTSSYVTTLVSVDEGEQGPPVR